VIFAEGKKEKGGKAGPSGRGFQKKGVMFAFWTFEREGGATICTHQSENKKKKKKEGGDRCP